MAANLGFVTRAQAQGALAQTGALESVKVMGAALAGAGLAALMITRLLPGQRVLIALGLGVGSTLLAANSPPLSLAENLGLGGAIGSALFLALDAAGEIVPIQAQSDQAAYVPPPAPVPPTSGRGRAVALRGLSRTA